MDKNNKKTNLDCEETSQYCPYLLQVSQKGIIYNPKDATFLLVKDIDEKSFFSVHFGPWELAGGRLQKGESIRDCLEREIKEEIGDIDYEIVDTLGAADIEYKTGKAIAIGHLLFYKGGEIKLSQEHSEYKWVIGKEIIESKEYKPWVKNLISNAIRRLEEREYLNGWKRTQADFENYKKRQAESQKEFARYSCQSMILEILPVLDNFYASTDHIPKDQKNEAWTVGIMHIQKQLEKVLENNGIREIGAKEGDEFDPRIHEAVADANLRMESESTNKKNMISKIAQRGYKMGEKVIRPARVIVE